MPDKPLIAHLIHHLQVGGLENGLINLINGLPSNRYRHAIICVDDYSEEQVRRLRPPVEVFALEKPPGNSITFVVRLYRLFRRLSPTLLHSRNLAGLDALLPAAVAGIRYRIHGEHGRDMIDLDGSNKKLRLLRRLHQPLVHRYVALSKDLERYLARDVGIPPRKIRQIYNGVDTKQYAPIEEPTQRQPLAPGIPVDAVVIGSVGRLQPVKNQAFLLRGFAGALKRAASSTGRWRLAVVGEGPELPQLKRLAKDLGIAGRCWFAGNRDDTALVMRFLDIFVLPSLAEGVSNTILEAMATGLPVIATAVGGNPELVSNGEMGRLVAADDVEALAGAITDYAQNAGLRALHGSNARKRALTHFSLDRMVAAYDELYTEMLQDAT